MNTITPGTQLFRRLTQLLQERIGLNPESVGKQTLEHAVEHRLKALRMTDAEQYISRLVSDSGEWSEFLEEIIVPESWFFRETTPFKCVREFTLAALKRANRPAVLRFLSIPCSRGEEPYSLAMTLLDAGLVPAQFEIVACDLSQRSLEFARRGRYRAIAFRETDPVSQRLTRQHFQVNQDEYELNANIKSTVKFRHANLAAPNFSMGLGFFDFIFCRNVLIYLTDEVRNKTMASFRRMLLPGGLLYLGHSECRLGPQAGATAWSERFPAAFTWQKEVTASQISTATAPGLQFHPTEQLTPRSKLNSATATEKSKVDKVAEMVRADGAKAVASSTPSPAAELARAKQLADSGRLSEAETLCENMLRSGPTQADVYCLLGVIVQARGDFVQAETHYHKSLFLEPEHREALTHLLLLAQRRGDARQTENYQRRLNRLREQGS